MYQLIHGYNNWEGSGCEAFAFNTRENACDELRRQYNETIESMDVRWVLKEHPDVFINEDCSKACIPSLHKWWSVESINTTMRDVLKEFKDN